MRNLMCFLSIKASKLKKICQWQFSCFCLKKVMKISDQMM